MPPCREKGGCPYHFHCRAMCLLSPLIPNPTWLPVPPSPRMSIGLVGLSSTIVMLAYRDCCSKGKQCHRERTTCGAPWCLGVGNERCRVYRMIPCSMQVLHLVHAVDVPVSLLMWDGVSPVVLVSLCLRCSTCCAIVPPMQCWALDYLLVLCCLSSIWVGVSCSTMDEGYHWAYE